MLIEPIVGYRAVALILLVTVSLNAILFDILPVLISALISALIWNFLFIPPTLTFHIGSAEDGLMFFMYFVVAAINAVSTHKLKQLEHVERTEQERLKALELYSTILHSLSHELRTPIATILGAIDTIQENKSTLSVSNRDVLYQEIELASLRLNRQVDNLLNMSRLEAGVIQPKVDWCDGNEVVYSVLTDLKDISNNHQIVFEPRDALPLLQLDEGMFRQIIHNLMHNALRYTPVHSVVTIVLSNNSTHCLLEVSDNGPGFPPDEVDKVFDQFYRLKSSPSGGTGLGLSIVRGFVKAMNGEIALIAEPMGGAHFKVMLPCSMAHSRHNEHE